ncbi:nucleotide exchange factor GrpE [Virgibacillus soli]|uniref:Protein GrpE n=1 Tax=Paracerasibacillus soli TaxID=480284 RepID=A0ABU5CQ75_9BACI|nr:nucleotide exchange factor GrpE [Virgibacillus soli]MDY0408489.1 nucleotide exchange factor GrpE [Virgibacillus soli]
MVDKNIEDVEEKVEEVEEVMESKQDDNVKEDEVRPEQAADYEKLQGELEKAKKEKEDLYERLLRLQAEYDNFKRRSQKEKQDARKYQSQDLVTELLPALDNFERALQAETTEHTASFVEGMLMIQRQLMDALTSQGVSTIETVGEKFDPNIHHAVMQVESEEYETDTVVEELQRGYLLKDKVIRPAMVKVNK